ncbi:Leucine-rich repeat-containing protein 49 [Hondaea fermentalgiana]|uniref:Leucine-rich repeat-containing protein 49 n=1 Tax=Hondaea fermentalgiana TaxID=2315210 RepID=A0A2R5GSX9_9STRA|nr:Leucine-rich repeat-containing protein 49 [Hondaea fermentalgiana]|eukprot:GBG33695.1 Leucine-rich repeat-containing protein 49 [Hondaea fermentalgiana]
MNLDRRGLEVIPIIENEPRLRLLNLQHNKLELMSNLRLNNLVFLDLYDNRITEIGPLDGVPMLRVLMMGRNRIKRLNGALSATRHLDVLDLHANELVSLEEIGSLASLRVLNVAGNKITEIRAPDVRGLRSLTELNARRNAIASVPGVCAMPALQHLFLSNNAFPSGDAVQPVLKCKNLTELTLDGNDGVMRTLGENMQDYRRELLRHLPHLHVLDLLPVQAESAMNVRFATDFLCKETPSADSKDTSEDPLQRWTSLRTKITDAEFISALQIDLLEQQLTEAERRKGYYEVDTSGPCTVVRIYGRAFGPLRDADVMRDVTAVELQQCTLDDLLQQALPSLLPQVTRVILLNPRVESLWDVAALASALPASVASLAIKACTIVRLQFYRPWLIFHLPTNLIERVRTRVSEELEFQTAFDMIYAHSLEEADREAELSLSGGDYWDRTLQGLRNETVQKRSGRPSSSQN